MGAGFRFGRRSARGVHVPAGVRWGMPMEPRVRSPHESRILTVLAASALLVSFVETMLTPALPDLQQYFAQAPYTSVAWILSAYLLVGVATIPIFTKLGDVYGKRRILTVVLAVYAAAVALAPLSPVLAAAAGIDRANALGLLIAARGLQGVGLAMFPLALAMVAEDFPAERIAPSQGLVAAMFAVGSAFGLVGGSYLIESFGWQVAYASMILPAVLLPILVRGWLPEGHRGTGAPVDYAAAGLLGGGVALFLLAITLGPTWGWATLSPSALGRLPLGIPVLMLLAALLIGAFFARSLKAAHPLIDLRRLNEPNLILAYVGAILVGLAMFTAFVVITVLVEFPVVGLGLSLIDFGLLSIPTTVGMFVAAPLVGRGVARYGPRPMVLLGATLSGLGFALLLAFHGTYLELIVEAVPTFVGLIAILVSFTNVIALSEHRGDSGVRMGLSEMFQDLGASIGPVVVASILATFTRVVLVPAGGGLPAYVPLVVPSPFAFQLVFGIGVAICLIAGTFGALLRNYVVTGRAAPATSPTPEAPSPGPAAAGGEAGAGPAGIVAP